MTRSTIALTVCSILTGSALIGCKVGPNFKQPEAHVPDGFAAGLAPATQPSADLTTWWTTFNDSQLNDLEQRAAQTNLDLRLATARLREARAQRGFVAADLLPPVDANGSYSHSRRSLNGSSVTGPTGTTGGTPPTGFSLTKREADLFNVGFDSTWEIDVFGGIQRAIEAADADIRAAEEDRRNVMVSLMAEVARDYLDLRGAQRQLQITRNNLQTQQDTLGLIRQKFKAGLTSDLDVSRQEAQLRTTASTVPQLQQQVLLDIHAISVLLGEPPAMLIEQLSPDAPLPEAAPAVPVGLPSDLLRRRPDIRRAEAQLASATANIGVATSDLFPKFSLTGSFGYQSQKFTNLVDQKSQFWSIGPAATWRIWDWGQIRSNIEVQNARQEQALVTYHQTVLTALREVEDSLVSYDRERARRQELADAVRANRRSLDVANQLYQRGLIDFLTVLDTQRSLLATEQLLVQSDTLVSSNLVQLYKALGGGWEGAGEAPSVPPAPLVPTTQVSDISSDIAATTQPTQPTTGATIPIP